MSIFVKPVAHRVDKHAAEVIKQLYGRGITCDHLYSTDEVAELLDMTPGTLLVYRATGVGPPFIKFGQTVRYRHYDLSRWLEERRQMADRAELARQVDGRPVGSRLIGGKIYVPYRPSAAD